MLKNIFLIYVLILFPIICISKTNDNPYLVFKVNSESLLLNNTNIKDAHIIKSEDGSYSLDIALTAVAAKRLAIMSAKNIGRTLFLFYGDNKLISKVTIHSSLGDKFQIANFPEEDGKDLIHSLENK